MLIRIDRSLFAFANPLKSEKFNENLTDAGIDSRPIKKTKKRVILIEVIQIQSFLTEKTPKKMHFEILRLLSKF